MQHLPDVPRRRPPQEPGPRLLPILLGIAVIGFAGGAAGKAIYRYTHAAHPATKLAARATPTPDYASAPADPYATNLPPLPTPHGTWYVGSPQPFRVQTEAAAKAIATPSVTVSPSPKPLAAKTPVPTPAPTRTPSPTSAPAKSPEPTSTATATPKPLPLATAKPAPSPVPTPKPKPKHTHTHTPHPVATLAVVVPTPSIAPTATPVALRKKIRIIATPLALATATPEPVALATPKPPASERIVRRYLRSVINGDEATAYGLLGAAPGDRRAQITEESFINTSARILSVKSHSDENGTRVNAEIETAGGQYYATYHLGPRDGRLLIIDHSFIKL